MAQILGAQIPAAQILVANRGEIACRIFQTARELGLETIAVYTDTDRQARHVTLADRAIRIASYLDADEIVRAALSVRKGAPSKPAPLLIHPGYGFLSERPHFVRAVEKAGLTFVGPRPETMDALGGKIAAKKLAEKLEIPTLPWAEVSKSGDLEREAKRIGFPLLLKASSGGGGKGMRVVRKAEELVQAAESARREAESAFGDGTIFLERRLDRPRHVEIQVFGDGEGRAVHLFERDCSAQRRHQKVIEEAPAPGLSDEIRQGLRACAVRLAEHVRYRSAGTVEFLVDSSGSASGEGPGFYFLEMNTRLQVEHPVTELVTGLDLVRAQIELALAEPAEGAQGVENIWQGLAARFMPGPGFLQQEPVGHAIEARLYAEDPSQGFIPTPGRVEVLRWPMGAGIRVDSGIEEGQTVGTDFDPMLAKIIVHAPDRQQAVSRLIGALRETVVLGLGTNQRFLIDLLSHPDFALLSPGKLGIDIGWIERVLLPSLPAAPNDSELALLAQALSHKGSSAGAHSSAQSGSRLPTVWELVGGAKK